MAWRGIHISQPAELRLREKQLIISQSDNELSFAIEDLAWVIFDTQQINLTGSLLSALSENGVVLLVPDDKHLPAGILLPFHQHYAQAYIAQLQSNLSQPLKKRLWQNLVKAKIRNQACLLQKLAKDGADRLFAMAERVNSGDPENIEAQAARIYWSNLFENFGRGNESDPRNGLLNYGYAVMRAALARACTAYGLLPAYGVHHASKSNAFNLVDDLIEPFRPMVDLLAVERIQASQAIEALSVEDRRYMANILHQNTTINGNQMTILAATEAVATSLVKAFENNSAAVLALPIFNGG